MHNTLRAKKRTTSAWSPPTTCGRKVRHVVALSNPPPPSPPTSPVPELDDDDGCRWLTVAEAAALERRLAEEQAELIKGNEEAAMQQRREAEARLVRIYDDVPCTKPDMYKCPRCYFHNLYLKDKCNKLTCGNCDKPFCMMCFLPSSTTSHHDAAHAHCAWLYALSR